MIGPWWRIAVLLPCLALGLAACSSDTESPPLEVEIFRASQKIVAQNRAARPVDRPPLRRADLDPLTGSFMEATLLRSDRLAYLYVNDRRDDPALGRIMVWRSDDNITLTTRNGVLVATRGLGGDILSSTVQVTGTRPGPTDSGEHVQMIRSLDDRQVRLHMACDLVDLGPELVEIVERKHPTRHLQQRCSAATGDIVNEYWIDTGNGLVWQSKQWAGPHIGYLRLRRLTNG